jgi:mRNA interferase MazF
VAPIASTVRDIPSEVFLSKQGGMIKDCAINFDHIQTVSKGKIGSLITILSADNLEQVSDAIQFALNL